MGKIPSDKAKKDLIQVDVSSLKSRLNHVYQTRRSNGRSRSNRSILNHDGLFEYLWDLKELALIEGKEQVEIPSAWIQELDSSVKSPQNPS